MLCSSWFSLTLTFFILLIFTTLTLILNRCHLGCWLILQLECGLSLVQAVGRHRRHGSRHRRHRNLLGGHVYLVNRLKDLFVCGVGEFHVADMGPDPNRQLQLPEGFHSCSAAATTQLGGLLADIIYNLISQLGWQLVRALQ